MDNDIASLALTMFVLFYFMPSVLAFWRRPDGWIGTCFFNLLFGWSGIGWVFAYVAANGPTRQEHAHRAEVARARDEFYLRERDKARGA